MALKINYKAETVLQNAKSYQRLTKLVERLETIEALKPAITEMKAGRGESAEIVFAELLQNAPENFDDA